MLLTSALLLSVVTLGTLALNPFAGVLLLVVAKPIIDATWEHVLVAGMPLTQITSGLVPLIVLGHLCFSKPGQQLSRMPLRGIWIAYTVCLCSSAVLIIYDQDARSGLSVLLRHTNGFIGFYMMQAYCREARQIQRLLLALLAAGLVPIGMGLFQFATGTVWRGDEQQIEGIVRNVGLYHDAIAIRQYTLQTILSVLLYVGMFPPQRLVITSALWSYAVLALVVLSKAYSKAGLIIIGLCAVSWTLLRRQFVSLLVMAGMSVIVGAYLASNYLSEVGTMYQKELGFLSGTVGADRTFNGRWYIWQEMFTEWSRLGAFAKLFGSGKVGLGAHNDYLQVLFHGGLVGLALYVLLLSMVGFSLVRNLWRRADPLAVAGFMVFLAWMVDTVGLVPSGYSGYQWFVWGLIGLGLRVRQDEQRVVPPVESVGFDPTSRSPYRPIPELAGTHRFPLVSR